MRQREYLYLCYNQHDLSHGFVRARPSAVLQLQWELTEKSHWVDCIHRSVDDRCYGVPAGGFSVGLTPEVVAHQQMAEEIGGQAADLRYIGRFYRSNGISNEMAHVYVLRASR